MGYQRTLSDQGLFLLPLSLKRRKEETAPEAHSNKEVSQKGTVTGRIGRRALFYLKEEVRWKLSETKRLSNG